MIIDRRVNHYLDFVQNIYFSQWEQCLTLFRFWSTLFSYFHTKYVPAAIIILTRIQFNITFMRNTEDLSVSNVEWEIIVKYFVLLYDYSTPMNNEAFKILY